MFWTIILSFLAILAILRILVADVELFDKAIMGALLFGVFYFIDVAV